MSDTTLVCAPWATEADVLDVQVDLSDIPQDSGMVEQGIAIASDILYALSGRRWRGAGCTRTVTLEPHPWTPPSSWLHTRYRLVDIARAQILLGRIGDVHPLWLPDFPVTEVTEVLDHNGDAVDPAVWRFVDGRRIDRLDASGMRTYWPCEDFTVTYDYGIAPPAGGVRAAATLGAQLALAACGSKNCRLPKRVTSITRQNVTLAVLDPMEFITKGQTGLPDVDLWIASVNPKGQRRRPAVWSPDVDTRNATYGG